MDHFYVFFVNRGYIVPLDSSLAAVDVHTFQHAIYSETQIKVSDQVCVMFSFFSRKRSVI